VGTAINQIHDQLALTTGYTGERVHGPPMAGETRRIYLDVKRAEEGLGWQAGVDLAGGLERTVAHFRAHQVG
jgi:nucleoside-diphosphate-sugar epimerase